MIKNPGVMGLQAASVLSEGDVDRCNGSFDDDDVEEWWW